MGVQSVIYDKATRWHCPHRLHLLCSLPTPPNRQTATDTPSARPHAAPLTPWAAPPRAPTPVLLALCKVSGPRVGGHAWGGVRGARARSGQSLEQRQPMDQLRGPRGAKARAGWNDQWTRQHSTITHCGSTARALCGHPGGKLGCSGMRGCIIRIRLGCEAEVTGSHRINTLGFIFSNKSN